MDRAVANARLAFEDGRWSQAPVTRRKRALFILASLIEKHGEELALFECLDVGKPITDALKFDVPAAAAAIRQSAEFADKILGKVYGADSTSLSYELRRPVGVVAAIVGWNFPLLLACSKVGPALAMGNGLVLKPSEITSLSAMRVAELAVEAGVPEGVFNVVHGARTVGEELSRHPDVDLVSFTGSSQTGRRLLIASGESNMKRLILECGGKSPNIVFDDCPDLEAAANAVVRRAFWNQGQVCTASSRLLIQASVKDDLLPLIVQKSMALGLGDPLDPDTQFGPLVSKAHQLKVTEYIRSGEGDGTHKAYESSASHAVPGGFYVAPVIFDDVSPGQRIAQEEVFGPVLSVMTFRDEEEAVKIANDTIYGLSAILWTQNVGRAHRLAQRVRAGWVVVNATGNPQGGPDGILSVGGHKQSGIGTEGGIAGHELYTSSTAVQIFA